MKFKKTDLQAMMAGDSDILELIETGEWISELKYETNYYVFKYENKFYTIENTRSGSYFTEYWYESEDWSEEVNVEEVEQIEVMIKKWVCKK